MSKYYIARAGDTSPKGPMSLAELQAGLAQGRITPDYMYCVEGGAQWLPVSSLAGAAPQPGVLPPTVNSKPDNLLVWSILVALFCCLPAGIYSIIKSASVDNLWMMGHHAEARAAAAEAKKWNLIGAIATCVLSGLWFAFAILSAAAGY